MVVFETPKELVEFLAKHRLTSDQLLFMFLIYSEEYSLLYQYCEQVKGLHPEEVQDLVRRGYLVNMNDKANQYWADSFIVTEKFTSEIYKHAEDAALEFWNTYPSPLYIEGRAYSTKGVDKEEFIELYMKKIGFSKRLHKRVMDTLAYAIREGTANMRIDKWFKGKPWEEFANKKTGIESHYGDKEF